VKLEGSIEIGAAPPVVWDALIDPVRLAACVPGARSVRQVDERSFAGLVSAAIGPVNADFSFTSTLTRADRPHGLEVRLEGTDSMTRSELLVHVDATLAASEAGGTLVDYRAQVDIHGRLAIVGEMVLRATAGAMIAQTTRCLRALLEAPP
jgi:uncharacterized protein